MKRSNIMIISFVSLTLILLICYVALTKKYTKEVHNVDIYEGFVVQKDIKTRENKVFFRIKPSGYLLYFTTNPGTYYKDGTCTYDYYGKFNPGEKNSLPVKFNLKFRIINSSPIQCFAGKPIDSIPDYLQKTFYDYKKALIIESAINIKYEHDTIIIEKASGKYRNSYTVLSEDIGFHTYPAYVNDKIKTYFLGNLHIWDINASSDISNDMQSINKNIKILSLIKPNGDTIEAYHSITLKNYGNLIANWYVNRDNFKRLRRYGIK